MPAQVKEALARMEREEKEAAASGGEEGKRKYNSLGAGETYTTPEEMEAWRIKRSRADDPLAQAQQGGSKAVGGYDLL
jgi:pre-mRNA-processing factor SLU7